VRGMLLLDPLVCCHSKLLHGLNHGLTRIGRKQINDLLVDGHIHELELISRLDAFRRKLNLNHTPVSSTYAFLGDSLIDQAFDDPCQAAA
jgi:hypothetical protein